MRSFLTTCALLLSFAAPAWAQSVPCESIDGSYRECRVGSSGNIRLVTEYSDFRCIEGVSWGTRYAGVVYVTRGCRAMFTTDDSSSIPRGPNRIVCESEVGNHKVCPANTSSGVALGRQLSRSPCVEDVTWGYDRRKGQIWVDDGCRGEFLLGAVSAAERAAPALDSVVVCGSADEKRTECKADTSAGVQIIRVLSPSACGFGREWGYDRKAIWVTNGCKAEFAVRGFSRAVVASVTCESKNGARNVCPAETRFGVAIVGQLNGSECALGRTWDFDDNGVWVTDGCSAQFALGGYRLAPDSIPAKASLLICDSLDGKRNLCAADTARGVGLVRQIGDVNCVLNRTWGYDREGVWVSDGCNAEFAVGR
jgi:hypothetical protein